MMLDEISDGDAPDAPNWREGLLRGRSGYKRCLSNAVLILRRHAEWQGVLAFDEFANSIVKLRPPPNHVLVAPDGDTTREWSESDTLRATYWMQRLTNIEFSHETVLSAVKTVAETRRIHPVREYLHSLKWDGTQRLPQFLHTYFGAEDTQLHAAFGRCWLVSAVARAMAPGCKVDTMLILEGGQGATKSSALKILAGEWFADTPIRLDHGQDAYQALRRKWIYEVAELQSFKGRDVTRIKEYVSSPIDTYRGSYGAMTKDVPRQVVFAGTTNEQHYFQDRTGNRRFWPVRCGTIDLEALERDRDQIWAEALERYMLYVADPLPPRQRIEKWWLENEEMAREAQEERLVTEDWTPRIAKFLEDSGRTVSVQVSQGVYETFNVSEGVPTWAVAMGALHLDMSRLDRASSTRIGIAMQELRWTKVRVTRNNLRQWLFFPPIQ